MVFSLEIITENWRTAYGNDELVFHAGISPPNVTSVFLKKWRKIRALFLLIALHVLVIVVMILSKFCAFPSVRQCYYDTFLDSLLLQIFGNCENDFSCLANFLKGAARDYYDMLHLRKKLPSCRPYPADCGVLGLFFSFVVVSNPRACVRYEPLAVQRRSSPFACIASACWPFFSCVVYWSFLAAANRPLDSNWVRFAQLMSQFILLDCCDRIFNNIPKRYVKLPLCSIKKRAYCRYVLIYVARNY